MKKRDQYGRFINDLKPDIYNVLDFCSIIYKLIPLMITAFIVYRYFDVSRQMSNLVMEITCGYSNFTCSCPTPTISKQNGF